jgi:hypothetical protein
MELQQALRLMTLFTAPGFQKSLREGDRSSEPYHKSPFGVMPSFRVGTRLENQSAGEAIAAPIGMIRKKSAHLLQLS